MHRPPHRRRRINYDWKIAKVRFEAGRRIVELPDDIRLEGEEVRVVQDPRSGDIKLLFPRPPVDWTEFFAFINDHPISDEDWKIFEDGLSEARGRPMFGDPDDLQDDGDTLAE